MLLPEKLKHTQSTVPASLLKLIQGPEHSILIYDGCEQGAACLSDPSLSPSPARGAVGNLSTPWASRDGPLVGCSKWGSPESFKHTKNTSSDLKGGSALGCAANSSQLSTFPPGESFISKDKGRR